VDPATKKNSMTPEWTVDKNPDVMGFEPTVILFGWAKALNIQQGS
jgi:hypothetical protein